MGACEDRVGGLWVGADGEVVDEGGYGWVFVLGLAAWPGWKR